MRTSETMFIKIKSVNIVCALELCASTRGYEAIEKGKRAPGSTTRSKADGELSPSMALIYIGWYTSWYNVIGQLGSQRRSDDRLQ